MKSARKRLLCCMVFVFTLMIMLLPTEEPQAKMADDFYYEIKDDGTVSISGYFGMEEKVIIPDTLEGREVTELQEKSIIGSSIIEIEIPDSITVINGNPFAYCSQLKTISISPFHDTYAVIDNVLFEKRTRTLVSYPCGLEAETYVIPEGIKAIGKEAFYDAPVQEVCLPDSLTEIGDSAFRSSDLKTFVLTEKVEKLGGNPFESCIHLDDFQIKDNPVYDLENNCLIEQETGELVCYLDKMSGYAHSLVIPDGIKKLGDYSIGSCYSTLERVTLPEGLEEIGAYAFENDYSLSSLVLPESVKRIGEYAFDECKALEEIHLPNNLSELSTGMFHYCISLKTVNIPEGIEAIPGSCFYKCANLKKISLPDGITTIDHSAFSSCTSLEEINLPESLEEIGVWAFDGCKSLKSLTFPEHFFSVYKGSFSNCPNLVVTIYGETGKELCDFCGLPYVVAESSGLDWLTSGGPDDPNDLGIWKIGYYVDKDGNDTEEPYIRNKTLFSGTFSNEKVSAGRLAAVLIVDQNGVEIRMIDRESGDDLIAWITAVDGELVWPEYTVKITDDSENDATFVGTPSLNNRIYFSGEDNEVIESWLETKGKLTFHITDNINKKNAYDFSVTDTSYYDHAWNAYYTLLEENGLLEAETEAQTEAETTMEAPTEVESTHPAETEAGAGK